MCSVLHQLTAMIQSQSSGLVRRCPLVLARIPPECLPPPHVGILLPVTTKLEEQQKPGTAPILIPEPRDPPAKSANPASTQHLVAPRALLVSYWLDVGKQFPDLEITGDVGDGAVWRVERLAEFAAGIDGRIGFGPVCWRFDGMFRPSIAAGIHVPQLVDEIPRICAVRFALARCQGLVVRPRRQARERRRRRVYIPRILLRERLGGRPGPGSHRRPSYAVPPDRPSPRPNGRLQRPACHRGSRFQDRTSHTGANLQPTNAGQAIPQPVRRSSLDT